MIGSLVLHIIDFRPLPHSAFDKLLIVVSERSKVFAHCSVVMYVLCSDADHELFGLCWRGSYGFEVSCLFEFWC